MTKKNSKKIFIAPLNWGLGHATRVLPLIRRFLQRGDQVFVAAHGRALQLLRDEVPECIFLDFPEYPIRYPRTRFFVTRFMLITFPRMLFAMWKEKRALTLLQEKYRFDYIISDNRFCLYQHGVKSYLISHQLRYILPFPIGKLEWLPEWFNYSFFKKYDAILIPDEKGPERALTGALSHDMRYLNADKLNYSGIFADMPDSEQTINVDIDYFIIVSGPEPQRSKLEKLIFEQAGRLPGKIVVALGKPERRYKIRQGHVTFYSYMNRAQMQQFMKRARFIIGRPGYTSVMEMVALGKKGLFIPTPGQIEQEYLAGYYLKKGWCYCVRQHRLDLKNDVPKAEKFAGFPTGFSDTDKNVNELLRFFGD